MSAVSCSVYVSAARRALLSKEERAAMLTSLTRSTTHPTLLRRSSSHDYRAIPKEIPSIMAFSFV